jgi:quinol monooxygenase YgiN
MPKLDSDWNEFLVALDGFRMEDAGKMNTKTLTVVAQVKAKPGKEREVREALASLVAPSRKDAGCMSYDLHQATDNPALFLFYENWASRDHLDRHLQKPDLQTVLTRVGQWAAEPPSITFWENIS